MSTEKIVKACPECSEKMVVRINGETDEEFLGCSQYPHCQHTEELPMSILLRRHGATTLPGFEE